MNAVAAVMTGKGVGAIATVCVIGDGAGDILKTIFKPIGKGIAHFEAGNILLGDIVDAQKVIDQVVIGCEGENEFAINCHGNPLVVEMIMELLAKHGAKPITTEQFLQSKIQNLKSRIAIEAKLEQLKANTIEGFKLLQNQIAGGLSTKAVEWLKTESLQQIQQEANAILKASRTAHYIIHGCKVVISGPANSGKSTLLNALAGTNKSIVADIPGTTRDWVSATCISGALAMEIFDTAGLDESLFIHNIIDNAAQEKSIRLVERADVVIWVLDGNREISNLKLQISNIPAIVAINKSDLGLKTKLDGAVVISAKNSTGIDVLTKRIRTVLGVESFDLRQPVCFTDRQKSLIELILTKSDESAAKSLITELLNADIVV
jgi:tRNA modification GTPase